MDVYGVNIPYKALTNFELCDYAKKLGVNLRGVFMRDNLPSHPLENECAIVNFNTSNENNHKMFYVKTFPLPSKCFELKQAIFLC